MEAIPHSSECGPVEALIVLVGCGVLCQIPHSSECGPVEARWTLRRPSATSGDSALFGVRPR